MREYTAKEIKLLKANPYTFKVTKNRLYFTIEFKEAFWRAYKVGVSPRDILEDLGYDLEVFHQKQIDSLTQRIKTQALSGTGFTQGDKHSRRKKEMPTLSKNIPAESRETLSEILNELEYLRQEVDFLKKIVKTKNTAARKY